MKPSDAKWFSNSDLVTMMFKCRLCPRITCIVKNSLRVYRVGSSNQVWLNESMDQKKVSKKKKYDKEMDPGNIIEKWPKKTISFPKDELIKY